jgi:hypothetical protein
VSATAPAIAGRCVAACIRVTGAAVHTVLRAAVAALAAVYVAAWPGPCPGPKGYWSVFELVMAMTASTGSMMVQHWHSAV